MLPNFPYSNFPSNNEQLNRIVQEHGGWLHILDPDTNVDSLERLLAELMNAGFNKDELLALKTLISPRERDKLLLQAAVLHRKVQLGTSNAVEDKLLPGVYASLQIMQITEEELHYACEHLAPHIIKWL